MTAARQIDLFFIISFCWHSDARRAPRLIVSLICFCDGGLCLTSLAFTWIISHVLIIFIVVFLFMIGSFLLLAVRQTHHFRCHEVMLENLLRVDALTRVQAHNLIEQVDELGVAHPFVATVIEAFLEVSE